ncbi:MAG TPA: hypothetical protein DIC19_05015 [Erysipelotrichaceae bacterium]|nr:hypothetical protein [Erysipelotrichaceae bacterium]
MKASFVRENTQIALCGLSCGLCPMHVDHYCPGCGGGLGNQVCKIARCSQTKANVSYCFECEHYPCDEYLGFNQSDSFISHLNHHDNLMRIKHEGFDVLNEEIRKKRFILDELLADFNDGRHKRFFCLVVNLLSLKDISEVMKSLSEYNDVDVKIKAKLAKERFMEIAYKQGLVLNLRK